MAETRPSIVATSVGVRSPIGAGVEQTCASIRAGINRYKEHAWFAPATADPEWDEDVPLVCSAATELDDLVDHPDRLLRLALGALHETLSGASLRRTALSRGALLVCLPSPEVLAGGAELEQALGRLLEASGLASLGSADVRPGGQAAVHLAIRDAIERLTSGVCDFCIVGGVDSYMFDSRLSAIDAAWRLKSLRNVDGFIPGEGAAFVLLERRVAAEGRGATALCGIGDVGVGKELHTIDSKKASTGAGLSEAIRQVLKGDGVKPAWILCDLNGESYRAYEWGLVLSRLGDRLAGAGRLTHPADCLGDAGAATGGLLLACAIQGFRRGHAPGAEALLWAGSDDGTRAALLTTREPERTR